jgi:hypothetical protein
MGAGETERDSQLAWLSTRASPAAGAHNEGYSFLLDRSRIRLDRGSIIKIPDGAEQQSNKCNVPPTRLPTRRLERRRGSARGVAAGWILATRRAA